MLRSGKQLRDYGVRATDGPIGQVDDLYFDDETWAIRYLVVNTGTWLSGRKVLVSPLAIGTPDWLGEELPVSLTKAQVEQSPDIDTERPVSRHDEGAHAAYYGYPHYWGDGGLWGMGSYPGGLTTELRAERHMKEQQAAAQDDGNHLRSCRGVTGYRVRATDGEIGHVDDLLVDERTWAIRYLVVNTSNWWGGVRVLVTPPLILAARWDEAEVAVNLTQQAVKEAPRVESAAQLEHESGHEAREHYCRVGSWLTPREPDAHRVP